MRSLPKRVFELADFETAARLKGQGRFQHFEVARSAADADVIINLPKLKTHGMTVLPGAVKNLVGCIPGKRKVQWHLNTGVNHEAFMQMLVDLSALLKPLLTIMDAVVGMERNCPGSGAAEDREPAGGGRSGSGRRCCRRHGGDRPRNIAGAPGGGSFEGGRDSS